MGVTSYHAYYALSARRILRAFIDVNKSLGRTVCLRATQLICMLGHHMIHLASLPAGQHSETDNRINGDASTTQEYCAGSSASSICLSSIIHTPHPGSHHENPMSTWYGYLSGDIQAQMSRVTPLLEALGHQFVFVDGLETCDSTEGKSQSITFAYHIRCMGSTWN
jgi:hypothetical protein